MNAMMNIDERIHSYTKELARVNRSIEILKNTYCNQPIELKAYISTFDTKKELLIDFLRDLHLIKRDLDDLQRLRIAHE